MALSAGTRFGPFEILASLGAGGMGEVYRARDLKLNRQVAIKVLPDHFADDPARLRRLEREAQVLAALNHPHIATIHGLEEADGTCGLVMELVEGEDLSHRIAAGPIEIDDALHLARQIAIALEAAHEQGIIHRDLKPANIKIRNDGALKVLDFGLAKAIRPDLALSATAFADSPTFTSPHALTDPGGALLGTAAYMSPEQARGKPVDERTDIWAFGCVLYEMLSGRSAFRGDTASDTVAAVLEREPQWDRLPANTPREVRRLLRRCLEKDPNRRLHHIADVRIEIEDIQAGPKASDRADAAPMATPPSKIGVTAALMVIGVIAAAVLGWALRRLPASEETRLEINTPPTVDPALAISPDGRKVVFVGRAGTQSQLFLRSLDSSAAQPLPGTEHGSQPFWSPDGRSIGFFADTKLKRIDIDGSSSRVLSPNSGVPIGGTWNRDGVILFADNPAGPIFQTTANGAERVAVTKVEVPQQRGHHLPRFLPDGRHFLFFVSGTAEAHGVYIAELGRPETKRLFDANTAAVYTSTGHLLFGRGQKLMAQRFNVDRMELEGEAFVVEDKLAGAPSLSASLAGPIAYRTGPADAGQRQLVWFDRSGREMDKVVYPDTAAQGPSLSHDGQRIAVYRFRDGNMDIWVYETTRHAWDRITFDRGDDIYPIWSPDDTRIAFAGFRDARQVGELYLKHLSDPPGSEKLLLDTPQGKYPTDWSADGRFLLFNTVAPTTDIWALPLDGDHKPFEVVRTEFNEGLAQFSPDGKWIAYQSDKTGREEIYLRPFPGPGADVPVSVDGGAQVRWNRNGKELFYVAADDQLIAVPIRESSDGQSIERGNPSALFLTNVGSTATLKYRQQYVVSPDGQSFVMQSTVGQASASPITVILNWKPGR